MREDDEPDRRDDHHDDRRRPGRGEQRTEECPATVELPAGRQECHEHQREYRSFLVVDALEQRHRDPDQQESAGGHVRHLQPALEVAGEHEEAEPRQAAEEVRRLEDAEREPALDPGKPPVDGRHGAREEQHGPAEKAHGREHVGNDGRPLVDHAADPLERLATPRDLVRPQDEGGNAEGEEVIDEPIGDQRPDDGMGVQRGREQRNDDGLEDPESPRDVADEPCTLGQEKEPQEGRKRDRVRRQQGPQRRARERPVERCHEDLRSRHPGRRRRELPLPDAQRPSSERDDRQVRGDEADQDQAQRLRRAERDDVEGGWDGRRLDEEHDTAERTESHPEREGREADDACDLPRRETPPRVEAQSHGATRQEGDAERLAEREPDEGCHRRAGVGEGVAGVATAEPVVHRERDVSERRAAERQRQPERGEGADGGHDVVVTHVA